MPWYRNYIVPKYMQYMVREDYAWSNKHRIGLCCFADDGLDLFSQQDGQDLCHPKYICILLHLQTYTHSI